MSVEHWRYDAGKAKTKDIEMCCSTILLTINPAWTCQGLNPDLCSERLATQHQSHGTVMFHIVGCIRCCLQIAWLYDFSRIGKHSQLFLHWYPTGLHFSFCRSCRCLIIVYTTVKLNWHREDFYGTFTKRKNEWKQWKGWSLSLVCGTEAHKSFYLVESSFYNHLHHFSCMLQNTLNFFNDVLFLCITWYC